jgi:hypothetical protein
MIDTRTKKAQQEAASMVNTQPTEFSIGEMGDYFRSEEFLNARAHYSEWLQE